MGRRRRGFSLYKQPLVGCLPQFTRSPTSRSHGTMFVCAVCREAFFLNTSARDKHQKICLALSNFYTPTIQLLAESQPESYPVSTSPSASTALTPEPGHPARGGSIASTHQSSDRLSTNAADRPSSSSSTVFTDSSNQKRTATKRRLTETSSIAAKLRKLHKNTESYTAPPAPPPPHRNRSPPPPTTSGNTPELSWELKKALQTARDYVIKNNEGRFIDLPIFVEAALQVVKDILLREMEITRSIKFNMVLEAHYEHPEEGQTDTRNFKTRSRMLFAETDDLDTQLQRDGAKLLQEESESVAEKSGWIFLNVKCLTLRVSKFVYKEPRGSSYVPLPPKLAKRNACVNVVNDDDKCFIYSMLTKYVPNVKHNSTLNEESFQGLMNKYNFDGLRFPVNVSQIKHFEKHNPNVSVNVFEYNSENKVAPLRIVDELSDHTDLLLLHGRDNVSHFVFIQDFAKLLHKQITKSTNKIVICKRCSQYKEVRDCKPNPETWLKNHLTLCGKHKPTEIKLPSPDKNTLQFQQFEAQIKVPFIVCADFESTLKPVSTDDIDYDGKTYQKHIENSFCTLTTSTYNSDILDEYGISTEPYLYRGANAGATFLMYLKSLAEQVAKVYSCNKPITMTEYQRRQHDEAIECDLCKRAFSDLNTDTIKCADHDHITGEFRYSLCNRCNLRCQPPNFIPIWIHNMSSYDQAFIITNLNVLKGCEVSMIPSNKEKMIAISVKVGKIWLRFLDSYRMMSASLDELTKNLPRSDLITSSKLVPPEHFDLIKRKGVYCYDYVTSEDKFLETSLPPKEAFKNKLNDTFISEDDYAHACRVWDILQCQTFGDFHDFYLTLDTCLLTDIINSFRAICYEHYKLDMCHFWTAPSLTWQAMLKHTGIVIELMVDYDMVLMVEASIRGGLVQSSLRYCKANNQFLECPTDYNANDLTSYLLYLDCNNLYGFSLSLPLPTGNFKWEDHPEKVDWSNLPADSPFGYILECDVDVPASVHDKLNDLPPLPEKTVPPNGTVQKLMATLNKKERYIAHYRTFQQAQKLGLRITKVHRVLKFSQSPWMKRYIDFNSNLRSKSSNDFSKSFFKLMNNAVYGKSLQNNRLHFDVRVVTTKEGFEKYSRQARFIDRTIIKEGEEDGIILVFLRKEVVYLDKPIYIGSVTLDLSKEHMYHFWYHVLPTVFRPPESSIHLCYLDTDGLVFHVVTNDNVYEILRTISKEHLDLSNYPDGHFLKDVSNKQTAGKFKDECKGRALYEHIGLRSKMYSQRFSSNPVTDKTRKNEVKKAKGVKTSFVDKKMRFEHYKDALFNKTEYRASFNLIRCRKFNLTSVNVNKKSLSFHDDKRFILKDNIHTLAHGHYKIDQLIQEHRRESSSQSTRGSHK